MISTNGHIISNIPEQVWGVLVTSKRFIDDSHDLEFCDVNISYKCVNFLDPDLPKHEQYTYIVGFNGLADGSMHTYYFLIFARNPGLAEQKVRKIFNCNQFYDITTGKDKITFGYDIQVITNGVDAFNRYANKWPVNSEKISKKSKEFYENT